MTLDVSEYAVKNLIRVGTIKSLPKLPRILIPLTTLYLAPARLIDTIEGSDAALSSNCDRKNVRSGSQAMERMDRGRYFFYEIAGWTCQPLSRHEAVVLDRPLWLQSFYLKKSFAGEQSMWVASLRNSKGSESFILDGASSNSCLCGSSRSHRKQCLDCYPFEWPA